MNLAALLHRPYAPGDPFLRLPGESARTYGEFDDLVAAVKAGLAAHDVGIGDRVVAQVPKSIEAVALYVACLRHGAIYVPLNTAYTQAEVDYFLDDAKPALFVRSTGLVQLGSREDRDHSIVDRADHDIAAMCYTSGTTGRSKGALLTHENLISNGQTLHDLWGFGSGDVLLHTLPIFHVHGLFVAMHCAMLNGSEVIFLPQFDLDAVLAHLPEASVMMGVPTHYVRLLADDRFGPDVCTDMRLFTSGSAPMTAPTHEQFTARTGHRILERYGMSECGMIASNPLEGDRVPGTVGFALPDVEVRVADSDGTALPAGDTGVVEVRGPNLFAGYWQKPDKTDESHRNDGFFITGDVGSLDTEGRLTLEGRASDMIISGGYNVYPKEIELLLDELDGVEESAVIGVPHPDFGEAVVAIIVGDVPPANTLDDSLARFKHPKTYLRAEALPRNALGKVQKNLLRDEHNDLFT